MEFKNLAEVTKLEEVPEGASVLAATAEGEVVRVPGDGLGGGGDAVVIRDNLYEWFLAMSESQGNAGDPPDDWSVRCISGHTFNDVVAAISNGEHVRVIVQVMYTMNRPPASAECTIVMGTNDGAINLTFMDYEGHLGLLKWMPDNSIVDGY